MIAVSSLLSLFEKDSFLTFNFPQKKFHRYGLFLMPRQKFEYGLDEGFQSNTGLICKRQVDEPDEKLISALRL
jgi:hypothetical protein